MKTSSNDFLNKKESYMFTIIFLILKLTKTVNWSWWEWMHLDIQSIKSKKSRPIDFLRFS